jgi:SIT4-associating protein SAP185/190
MNKRNAAAAAAAGEEEGEHGGNANGAGSDGEQADHDDDEDAGFSVLKGSQAASELTSSTGATPWELRDPFADDDDDDAGGDGSGSDDGRDDGDVGSRSSAWNRGGWWRGVVRTAKRGGAKRGSGDVSRGTLERFGDGRDDSDESDEEREVDDDDVDDEEFGDFAMPEADAGRGARHDAGTITGIDPAREKVLLKPLPVHPASNKSGGSPFGSLWPFSTQAFGAGSKDKGREEEDEEEEVAGANDDGKRAVGEEPDVVPEISAEPLELGPDETVVGEDGKKIDRAVEAKRRTSIEDPDEDDIGLKEVVVGRGG